MTPAVLPQLVANDGARAMRAAIADPERFACEPKVDGELTTGQFRTTMAALLGSKQHRADLRFVAFDVPVLAGVDLRRMPWAQRRERLELLAQAFELPFELFPIVDPSTALVDAMQDGRLEGIVLKDRTSPYRDGSRAGWTKVKDRSWYERESWRFDRR